MADAAVKSRMTREKRLSRNQQVAERCKTEPLVVVAKDVGLNRKTVKRICDEMGVEYIRLMPGPPYKDIAGQTFDRLTAERFSGRQDSSGYSIWECRCQCGAVIERSIRVLANNRRHACLECQNASQRDPEEAACAQLLLAGCTLAEAGNARGLTRERIRQKVSKYAKSIQFWATHEDIKRWVAAAEARGMKLGGYINLVMSEATA